MTTLTGMTSIGTTAMEAAGPGPGSPRRPRNKLWRAFTHNRKATAGLVLMTFFLVLAIFPGEIAPYDGQAMEFQRALGPSWAHWFGTTAYGQDILSQLILGTRQSLIIAFAVGALATTVSGFPPPT